MSCSIRRLFRQQMICRIVFCLFLWGPKVVLAVERADFLKVQSGFKSLKKIKMNSLKMNTCSPILRNNKVIFLVGPHWVEEC